ncbi:MAG: hypothetical protein ACHP7E_10795, partial [Burkholderiales bacterium]
MSDDPHALQRIPQVVEHAHEPHQVELFAGARELVDLHLAELDAVLQPELLRRPVHQQDFLVRHQF